MSDKLYQQIECVEEHNAPSTARLIVWAEARAPLGSIVTFKETGDTRWRVTTVYGVPMPLAVNRGWGLDLPKSQRTER